MDEGRQEAEVSRWMDGGYSYSWAGKCELIGWRKLTVR